MKIFTYPNSINLLTTLSTLKPYLSITSSPGADAPNLSTPIFIPSGPAYQSHPKVEAASIVILFSILDGSTTSLYSSDCDSNLSKLGIETTRTL